MKGISESRKIYVYALLTMRRLSTESTTRSLLFVPGETVKVSKFEERQDRDMYYRRISLISLRSSFSETGVIENEDEGFRSEVDELST